MNRDEIPTLEYLIQMEKRLTTKIDRLAYPIDKEKPVYYRSKDVRKMLSISDNTLRLLRNNSDLPYTFLGNIYYYNEQDILKLLEKNTIINK